MSVLGDAAAYKFSAASYKPPFFEIKVSLA